MLPNSKLSPINPLFKADQYFVPGAPASYDGQAARVHSILPVRFHPPPQNLTLDSIAEQSLHQLALAFLAVSR